jgi:hypothetical protein
MINRRDESGKITNDAAAKTDYEGLAIQSRGNHLLTNCASLFERFRFLTRWNRD